MVRIHSGVDQQSGGAANLKKRMGAIWALRPEIGAAQTIVRDRLADSGTLSPRLKELIRLRIAFHNQCRTCMAVRYVDLSDNLVCSLEKPMEAPDLQDNERAALKFADLFASDHLAIDDAVYDGLRVHFDEGELVEIGALCAFFVGFGRLAATWQVVEDLGPSFQGSTGTAAPWGHSDLVTLPAAKA